MFTAERRGLATDERSVSLVPVVISLLNTYAGLSAAVAGFVFDSTMMVVVGTILVGSASVLIRWPWSIRTRKAISASHWIHRRGR
jgi:hypothetical protein